MKRQLAAKGPLSDIYVGTLDGENYEEPLFEAIASKSLLNWLGFGLEWDEEGLKEFQEKYVISKRFLWWPSAWGDALKEFLRL